MDRKATHLRSNFVPLRQSLKKILRMLSVIVNTTINREARTSIFFSFNNFSKILTEPIAVFCPLMADPHVLPTKSGLNLIQQKIIIYIVIPSITSDRWKYHQTTIPVLHFLACSASRSSFRYCLSNAIMNG